VVANPPPIGLEVLTIYRWDFEAEKTAEETKDLSRIDISYALYLLARGVSDNENPGSAYQ
jgi:hypothetical protein